jgi:hypothetical protein
MIRKALVLAAVFFAFVPFHADAQSSNDTAVLRGLAPVTVLANTPAGKAALSANFTVTGGIQTGAIRQATPLPFAEQQQQALRDAYITGGNFTQLADGLGSTLGAAYQARARTSDRSHFTSVSKAVADLMAYAEGTTSLHAGAGKFFFANATTDGKKPVSSEVAAILKGNGGHADMFGTNYGFPAGGPGSNAYGNSRPFQTEPSVLRIEGPDYFNVPSDNAEYNHGILMNLTNSPSYPSGHTTYGYTGAVLLAVMVPERYQEMMARGAEYGNDRILMGAHYAMDVLGGRTLALYDMAHLLANDPMYMGKSPRSAAPIKDFQAALKAARADVSATLKTACGEAIEVCAKEDIGRFNSPAVNEAFFASTLTYNLPVVYPQNAGVLEDVGKVAPEAGYLLTVAFPPLTLEQADRVLTETEGPGGGFLDDGSGFGVYSRLNLYAAAGRAAVLAAGQASRVEGSKDHPVRH